jgi:hypothetical protein
MRNFGDAAARFRRATVSDELTKLRDGIARRRDSEAVQRKAVSDYIQTLVVS